MDKVSPHLLFLGLDVHGGLHMPVVGGLSRVSDEGDEKF